MKTITQAKLNGQSHPARIRRELREAGVTPYGMLKFVSHYLPQILHDAEHVEAVVYGRYHEGGKSSLLDLNEGWLVATDYRVLFIDHKPGFTHVDEISYDIVAGVQLMRAWPSSAITLFSKIGKFPILFANKRCAAKFMDAIEDRRLVKAREGMFLRPNPPVFAEHANGGSLPDLIGKGAMQYLRSHDLAIFSAVGHNGEARDQVVYYLLDEQGNIYVLAKDGSQKSESDLAGSYVTLTAIDSSKAQMLQVEGTCKVEPEQSKRDWVIRVIARLRGYGAIKGLFPSNPLQNSLYTVLRIFPTSARFIDFVKDRVTPASLSNAIKV